MYCISFINVFFNADESYHMTETTVVYPQKSPSSGNRGASCLCSFAGRSQPGHGTLSLEATAIPPPAPASPRPSTLQTGCHVPCCFQGTPCYLLLFTSAPSLGLMLGMDIIKKSSFKLQVQG